MTDQTRYERYCDLCHKSRKSPMGRKDDWEKHYEELLNPHIYNDPHRDLNIPHRDLASVRIELGINAQRIISQMQTNNVELEETIQRGVTKAINELTESATFEDIIVQQTKNEILSIVRKSVFGYQLQRQIEKAIALKTNAKVEEYANHIADELADKLGIQVAKKTVENQVGTIEFINWCTRYAEANPQRNLVNDNYFTTWKVGPYEYTNEQMMEFFLRDPNHFLIQGNNV